MLNKYERNLDLKVRRHYPTTKPEFLELYADDPKSLINIIKLDFNLKENQEETLKNIVYNIIDKYKIGRCRECDNIIKGKSFSKYRYSNWGQTGKGFYSKICAKCNTSKRTCRYCKREVQVRGMMKNKETGEITDVCNLCATKRNLY